MGKKIKYMSPEERQQTREGWRVRQQNKRDRDAEKEAERVRESTFDSPLQFWEAQRTSLQTDELAKMLERQETVFDTLHWMEEWINGTYNVSPHDGLHYVGLDEGISDLLEDVGKHGLVTMEITLIDRFWEDTQFFQRVVGRGEPTATFAKYGVLVGVPERRYYQFAQKFLQKSTMPAPKSKWVTIKCQNADCTDLGTAVPKSIADGYHQSGTPYRCQRCQDAEQKSRKLAVSTILGGTSAETIFDRYRRVKDQ